MEIEEQVDDSEISLMSEKKEQNTLPRFEDLSIFTHSRKQEKMKTMEV